MQKSLECLKHIISYFPETKKMSKFLKKFDKISLKNKDPELQK